jgi:hypothetical protein
LADFSLLLYHSSISFIRQQSLKGLGFLRAAGDVLGSGKDGGTKHLQLRSNEITEGFSGAPVWDVLAQRVIGMVYGVATPDSLGKMADIAFAIPTETLRAICPALQISEICPYRNLEAFTEKEQDVPFFFGREGVIDQLVDCLQQEPRFLAVFGPSGCGKSSVVRAGLIPQLKKELYAEAIAGRSLLPVQ